MARLITSGSSPAATHLCEPQSHHPVAWKRKCNGIKIQSAVITPGKYSIFPLHIIVICIDWEVNNRDREEGERCLNLNTASITQYTCCMQGAGSALIFVCYCPFHCLRRDKCHSSVQIRVGDRTTQVSNKMIMTVIRGLMTLMSDISAHWNYLKYSH